MSLTTSQPPRSTETPKYDVSLSENLITYRWPQSYTHGRKASFDGFGDNKLKVLLTHTSQVSAFKALSPSYTQQSG